MAKNTPAPAPGQMQTAVEPRMPEQVPVQAPTHGAGKSVGAPSSVAQKAVSPGTIKPGKGTRAPSAPTPPVMGMPRPGKGTKAPAAPARGGMTGTRY